MSKILARILVFIKNKGHKMRDLNIAKSYLKELNLATKVVKSKKIYTRNFKHKAQAKSLF